MRYLVTGAEMKRYDQNCMQRIGIPSMVLMERAALETFYVLREKGLVKEEGRVLVLAGVGNNGGDGLALARLLSEAGMKIFVYVVGNLEKASTQWKEQRKFLEAYEVIFVNKPEEPAYDIVIDALFGVGLARELQGEYEDAIECVNALAGFKVSMDVPSGLGSDDGRIYGTAFEADLTVTYGFEKKGLYLWPGCEKAGEVRLADVGISERSFYGEAPKCFLLDEELGDLLPKRKKDGNKGTFGKALVIAGSRDMTGAAILCTRACYRLGGGMVKLLSANENRTVLQETIPEAMFGSISDEITNGEAFSWCDVICIGPGLGRDHDAREILRSCLTDPRAVTKPIVIDADGLNLLSENEEYLELLQKNAEMGRTIVLTPHPGELLRLLKALRKDEALTMEELKACLEEHASFVSEKLSVITVAKDARTIISQGSRTCINVSGNSGLGTAGSGDVLAGIITSFLCQEASSDPFLTTCRAVRTHGLLGDLCAKKGFLGEHGVMANDLCDALKTEIR